MCLDTPKKGKRAQKKETKVTVKETKTPKSYLPSGDPGVDYEMHVTSTKVETFTFKCPFHYCDTCYDFYHDKESKSLITCMLCPKAYHMNCVEPGSRFNALFLICPLHPNEALPAAESQKFSFEEQLLDSNPNKKRKNGKTEATITSKKKTKAAERSDADLFFEQIVLSDEFPNAKKLMDNHYRLQKHLIEDMNIIPSTFKLIQKNDYDTLPNKDKMYTAHIPEEPCNCTEICDDSCINRILRIECFDKLKKNLVNPNCSGSICRVGSQCTNRALQNRDYAKVKVFQEHAMGKGLKAAENIRCGALVIEYIGEIIDYQEVQRRMSEQVRLSPTDKDFYIMELDSGMYVDGKFKGNLSRFINHSCDPNCELQRWVVAGQRRIAITAIRDIKNGEPLSYDYQFDTSESDIFKCHCGTAICRGTMAPKKKEASKSSKQERQRLIDAGRNKEKDFLMNLSNEGEWKRSYTSNTIPGDALHEVRNGPIRSLLSYGREKHLFLVRNMKKTNNFLRRRNKLLGDEYDG